MAGGAGVVHGVHDVSDGGLLVTLAELALGGGVGAVVDGPVDHAALLSELPGRVVVATPEPQAVLDRAAAAGVPAEVLGRAGGDRLVVGDRCDVDLATLRRAAGQAARAVEAPTTHR